MELLINIYLTIWVIGIIIFLLSIFDCEEAPQSLYRKVMTGKTRIVSQLKKAK